MVGKVHLIRKALAERNTEPLVSNTDGDTVYLLQSLGQSRKMVLKKLVMNKQQCEVNYSGRRLHICSGRLIIVALSLWPVGCNNQQPATHDLPAPEITVNKPEQKEVVDWNEFTGRTAAVKLVNVTPRVSGYIVFWSSVGTRA